MTAPVDEIIGRYPKARPALPEAQRRVYEREYKLNRQGGSLLTRMSSGLEAWMHRRVAAAAGGGDVLELGAGTLNQLGYEAANPGYDVIEPFHALYADSQQKGRIRAFYDDIVEVPAGRRYQRITSVAVLEHVDDLPVIMARSALLLADDGVFQAGIPSEGGLAWGLAWRTTTGVAYWLRNRLDYGVLMRHEHLNTAAEIETMTRHFFGEVRVARFPLPARQLSFYSYLEARRP
ncbi:MAG TPA: methyltransferase domain-containing protein, partial [Devosia sp.]|nr:methyltransferase domain-containing protein [Devosia sp.]